MIYEVIVPKPPTQQPSEREISVARLLSVHFKCIVVFIAPNKGFKQKTPDIIMLGNTWEIKSPTGSSKNTIEYQIRTALRQSPNVIFDGRFIKIGDKFTVKELKHKSALHRRLKRLIYVSKDETVLEIIKR